MIDTIGEYPHVSNRQYHARSAMLVVDSVAEVKECTRVVRVALRLEPLPPYLQYPMQATDAILAQQRAKYGGLGAIMHVLVAFKATILAALSRWWSRHKVLR